MIKMKEKLTALFVGIRWDGIAKCVPNARRERFLGPGLD